MWGFPGGAYSKEPTCQCRKHKRCRFDPWVGKIPWRRHGNVFQYSCLENPTDRRAWRATVHRVAKSRTRLKRLSTAQHTYLDAHIYKHTLHIFIHRCTDTHTHRYTHTEHRLTHTQPAQPEGSSGLAPDSFASFLYQPSHLPTMKICQY